jgi:hypothetical protein
MAIESAEKHQSGNQCHHQRHLRACSEESKVQLQSADRQSSFLPVQIDAFFDTSIEPKKIS